MTALYTPAMAEAEAAVARRVEAAWKVTAHHFGRMDAVDWWLERDGRTCAVAEVKTYSGGVADYTNAWLSLRKWLALYVASLSGAVPLFVVGFADGAIRWVDVRVVDPRNLITAGRGDRGRPNDWEPIITVPVDTMEAVP